MRLIIKQKWNKTTIRSKQAGKARLRGLLQRPRELERASEGISTKVFSA